MAIETVTANTKNLSTMPDQGAATLAFLACLLIASCLPAAIQSRVASSSSHGASRDPQTEASFAHFYDMDYDRATQEFEKIVEKHPTDPFAVNHFLTGGLIQHFSAPGRLIPV